MATEDKKSLKEKLLNTIGKLEQNPNDKVRILGDIGIVGVGTVLGTASAGAIAAAAGATSVPVLTTIGSWVGLGIFSATPVGWMVGTAVAGGAAAYGISRLINDGARAEERSRLILAKLKERLKEIAKKEKASEIEEIDKTKFYIFLKDPLEREFIDAEDAQNLMVAVENGQMPLEEAYRLVENCIREKTKAGA